MDPEEAAAAAVETLEAWINPLSGTGGIRRAGGAGSAGIAGKSPWYRLNAPVVNKALSSA